MIFAAPAPPGPAFVATDAHPLSPTGVAALLIFAFVIDFFAIGPAWFQTRMTFIAAVVGFRQGFNGSALDEWTVERGTDVISTALDQAKGAYIAGAVPLSILGIGVGVLFIYTLGCMLPVKWSRKLGRIATAQFKESGFRKVSWPIWILALPLALMAELPVGWMGDVTVFVMDLYSGIGSPIPALVFGVA